MIRVNVSARERLDYSQLEDVYLVGRFHHPPTSYLIRVNVSARERLDYSELEDVYLVLEEDGTEVQLNNGTHNKPESIKYCLSRHFINEL